MTHYRSDLRVEAKAILRANALFESATEVLSSAKVDADTVPCWSVSTPSEDREDLTRKQFRADINLVVAVSIKGSAATIEDLLDDHSETIETLLIEGLKSNTGVQSVLLRRTEIKTGPEAAQIIGSVMMLFEITGFLQDV
jgi:molecular chaperone DnaK (HSP70)